MNSRHTIFCLLSTIGFHVTQSNQLTILLLNFFLMANGCYGLLRLSENIYFVCSFHARLEISAIELWLPIMKFLRRDDA